MHMDRDPVYILQVYICVGVRVKLSESSKQTYKLEDDHPTWNSNQLIRLHSSVNSN